MFGKRQFVALTVFAFSQLWPLTARVDDAVDRKPIDCLALGTVRQQVVVDDATILYFLKDGRVYVNVLKLGCPGLKEFGPTYPQRIGGRNPGAARACAGYHIWANPASGEQRLEPKGPNPPHILCPLGQFFPISEEATEEMLNPGKGRSVSSTPTPPKAEAEPATAARLEVIAATPNKQLSGR